MNKMNKKHRNKLKNKEQIDDDCQMRGGWVKR